MTTEQPTKDGWANCDWGPGIPGGYYCPAHADAIEKVLEEGGLDDPENDLSDDLDER